MKKDNKDIYSTNIKWFEKTYMNLVESRKYRGTKKKRGDGFNKHHILPKCLGGKDENSNYVLLTFREHIIAHMLLHRIYPNSSELAYALLRMIQSGGSGRKENIYKIGKDGKVILPTTRELESLRNQSIEYLRNINTGKHLSQETKEKIRKSKTGVKYSETTKKLLSEQRKGRLVNKSTREKISKARVGIKFSEEHKRKLSLAGKKRKLSEFAKKAISGEKSLHSRKVIDPKGRIFNSVKECAEFYKVNPNTISEKWIKKKPEKGFKYLDPPFTGYKVQGPDGTIYNSLKEAGRAISRVKSTIKRWIEKFPDKGWKYYKED